MQSFLAEQKKINVELEAAKSAVESDLQTVKAQLSAAETERNNALAEITAVQAKADNEMQRAKDLSESELAVLKEELGSKGQELIRTVKAYEDKLREKHVMEEQVG